jgi:hypothetical protein
MKGFEGFKQKYFFGSKLRTWTSKCMQCETEFKKLQQVTDYVKNVEPLVYLGLLVLGVVTIILTGFWCLIIISDLVGMF